MWLLCDVSYEWVVGFCYDFQGFWIGVDGCYFYVFIVICFFQCLDDVDGWLILVGDMDGVQFVFWILVE